MKRCFKCGVEKEFSEFYKHPMMADGRLGKCKQCTKLDVAGHRVKNLERVQEYDRKRNWIPHRVLQRRDRLPVYRIMNPDQDKARQLVASALRSKKITKKPCSVCGDTKVEAHHSDYKKPLEIQWLCTKHHKEKHRKYDYSLFND